LQLSTSSTPQQRNDLLRLLSAIVAVIAVLYTQDIMKNINIWKVFGLSVITFGIYLLFWFVRRRNEMATIYKQSIPHAGWIVAVALLAYLGSGLSWGSDYMQSTDLQGIAALVGLTLLTAGLIISIWWIWRFSKAAAYVTSGRMPAGWSFVLYLLASPLIMGMFLQHYFNQAEKPSKLQDNPSSKASPKLKLLAIIIIVVSLGLSAWISFITFPNEDIQQIIDEQTTLNTLGEKTHTLAKDHQACVDKLNQDFKEVTAENETAYDKAYDACEVIRKEQNQAVEEYNRLLAQ
jgi:hypothetical protein